jgi:hypothetical protein
MLPANRLITPGLNPCKILEFVMLGSYGTIIEELKPDVNGMLADKILFVESQFHERAGLLYVVEFKTKLVG